MHRNLYHKINKLLENFPVVAIIGPRQCGKTTLAKQVRPHWQYFDLEKPSDFNRFDMDPEFFFQQNPEHIIIDEAQISAKLFQVLRSVIDAKREIKGRFIITGSSSPDILTNISESLAGRIATVELGTFKFNERLGQPLSELYLQFQQDLDKNNFSDIAKSDVKITDVANSWFRGGYPEPVLSESNEFYAQWMENYEATYIHRDIARLYPKLNKVAYQRFLSMLCRMSGTILNKSDIGRSLEVSESSIREFLNIASGTFLWRQLPSYENAISKSIVKMPKGHIRDSGLLHALLGISNQEKLFKDPIVGASFEAFVIEELTKGLQAILLTQWHVYYYRTRGGAEVDLILEGPFGILPIEIKYGIKTDRKQLKSLSEFITKNNCPFGLLINQAPEKTWLTPTILQLPVNYL